MKGKKPRRRCKNCNKYFTLQRDWQKFCSVKCRSSWHCERIVLAMEALEEKEAKEN